MPNYMRIVYQSHRKPQQFNTAYLPQDAPPRDHHFRVAKFIPEHDVDGGTLNMRTGTLTSRRWHELDQVEIEHASFRASFSLLTCATVRVMSEDDAAAIAAADRDIAAYREEMERKIAELKAGRQALLEIAFKRARKLHQRDIDPEMSEDE
jgi:hypothetical protein